MRRFLIVQLIPALFLCSCGYAPVAHSPGLGVKTLFIEPLVNRTAEPFLDSIVTNSLVERLGRDSRMRLVKHRAEAEAVLSGQVASYHRSSISYDSSDKIREYRSTMRVAASVRRVADGKILWKNTVSWTEDSQNSSDLSVQQDNETSAIQKISERLAEQLYHRLQENF